jgi:hypothetical protein
VEKVFAGNPAGDGSGGQRNYADCRTEQLETEAIEAGVEGLGEKKKA